MKSRLLPLALAILQIAVDAAAQSPAIPQEIEKARKVTLPAAMRKVEETTDAKVAFEVDAASFGNDSKAWTNFHLVVDRIVAALGEAGKDQVGKDALAKNVQRVVIEKRAENSTQDSAALKHGTLTVKTSGDDLATSRLQEIVKSALDPLL